MEIEVTYQADNSLQQIQETLENQGCKFKKNYIMSDIYFYNVLDNSFNANSGKITDTCVLRQVEDEIKIVVKKRVFNEKSEEIGTNSSTLHVIDKEEAIKFIEKNNFEKYLEMENSQYEYKHEKYDIYVQCIKNLGIFLEVEGKDSTLEELKSFVRNLNLNLGENSNCRKAELLLASYK
jgi:predicted adenylyl cyclase CyaB